LLDSLLLEKSFNINFNWKKLRQKMFELLENCVYGSNRTSGTYQSLLPALRHYPVYR